MLQSLWNRDQSVELYLVAMAVDMENQRGV